MTYTIESNDIPIWSGSVEGNFYYLHRAMIKSPDGTETPGYVLLYWVCFYWNFLLDVYPDSNLKLGGGLPWEIILESKFVLSRRPMPPANRHEVLEFVEELMADREKLGIPIESSCLLI